MLKAINSFCLCAATVFLTLNIHAADSDNLPGTVTSAPPKSFQIRNKKYPNLLRPEEANSANGTPIVLYPAQAWKCMTWKLHPSGESCFQLQNHFTSKTFAPETGADKLAAAVKQVPFVKDPAERPTWRFTKLNDGAYRITEVKSGKALTASSDGIGSGVKIVVQAWKETDDQKWELLEIDPKKLTM